MKNINLKLLNAAFWIELILCYLLPFKTEDNFIYQMGFPMPFLTIYSGKFIVNPLASTALNPISLVFNVLVIYFVIFIVAKGCKRHRKK